MDSIPVLKRVKLDNPLKASHFRSVTGNFHKDSSLEKVKVSKRRTIFKRREAVSHTSDKDAIYKNQDCADDQDGYTGLGPFDLEIDENVLKVCKIYLKRSLFNDCKLVRLNPNYLERIVDMIFNMGFLAKRGHFRNDILDLIHLMEVPEPVLNQLGMNRNHRLAIFKGICFKGEMSHPEMPRELGKSKVLLVRYFSQMEEESNLKTYETLVNLSKSLKLIDKLVEEVARENIKVILCENYVPYDIGERLSRRGIVCISKVGSRTMNRMSLALNCEILHSMNGEKNYGKYTGNCRELKVMQSRYTIVSMKIPEHFKGFTILISTRMIRAENLNRIKELIKISIVRLQGIVEELELIDNLNGRFLVDMSMLDAEFEEVNDVCENFSDYLDMVLGNTSRSSVHSTSPRSNLNYFSCDIYYNKIIESEITCEEYRKLTRLQFFKYYTRMNELCMKPTFETVPIGNYEEGLFFSDFISEITNSIKINKCIVNSECSESFINHQLHFETAYSNIENMRMSVTFQISSENYQEEGINVKTFCTKCNESQIHRIQDLTLGRFLQMLLFNKAYRSKCDHMLFTTNKFSVLSENYSITFNLTTIPIYTVVPEFNEPEYNCSRETVEFRQNNGTLLDKRLDKLKKKVENIIKVENTEKLKGIVFENLYFREESGFASAMKYFYSRVFEMVRDNFHNLASYEIERHLPCICRISRAYSKSYPDNSQWVCTIKNMSYGEFLTKYENSSAFGIELNYRLEEKLKESFETGNGLQRCEKCGLEGYTTLAEVDILNWFYIIVHVFKAFESKIVKLKAGLSQKIENSEEIKMIYGSLKKTEEDVISVFLQCMALLIYSKYFCPRDPMYTFMIVRGFFVSFYNLVEKLLNDYRGVSHLEKVDGFKIVEYDKNSIIVVEGGGLESKRYEKIDFIKGVRVETWTEKEKEKDKNDKNNSKELVFEEEEYTMYTIEEFVTFSQYFAILSGIQDLSNEVKKKTNYFKVVSKIRINNKGSESIICPEYKPIIQAGRDVSNILANGLMTKEYFEKLNKVMCEEDQNICTKNYIKYIKTIKEEYQIYMWEFLSPEKEVRRGVWKNYLEIRGLKEGIGKCVFKSNSLSERQKENKNIERSDFEENVPIYSIKKSEDVEGVNLVMRVVLGEDKDEISKFRKNKIRKKRKVPRCRHSEPFYGVPVIYTNSRILNYERLNIEKEVGKILVGWKSNQDVGRIESILSNDFMERFMSLKVQNKVIMNHMVKKCNKIISDREMRKKDGNCLMALVGVLEVKGRDNRYLKASKGNEILKNEEELDEKKEIEVYYGPYLITVYHEREFHKLRHKYCRDDLNFVRSLSRCTRMPSIGKSGSPIFVTYDAKYTVKLINKHEMSLFVTQGKEFFKYFEKNKTLMSLPYGLFNVKHIKTKSSINCFVMQNIDYFQSGGKVSFDLKGISLKRYINLSKDHVISLQSSARGSYGNNVYYIEKIEEDRLFKNKDNKGFNKNKSYVLMDQNFKLYTKGCPLQLDHQSMEVVKRRLETDLKFLSSINIVDYSLLLRISPSESTITLGLIDFLRPYTWDKQIETVGKRLANIGQAPTIVSPNEYSTRFENFIQKIFIYPYQNKNNKRIKVQNYKNKNETEINFNYQIQPYVSCQLCSLLKYLYSNPYFTCLKYYMAVTSPEIVQYLHIWMMENLRKKGISDNEECKELKYRNKEQNVVNYKFEEEMQDELEVLVKLIQHVYQSPTIKWKYV